MTARVIPVPTAPRRYPPGRRYHETHAALEQFKRERAVEKEPDKHERKAADRENHRRGAA